MSRRRLVLIGVTMMSAIGFIVDRFLLSAPAPAAAAEPAPRAPGRKPAGTPAQTSRLAETYPDRSLAYLERLEGTGPGRDIFSMSPDMLLHYRMLAQREQERAAQSGPRPGSPEEFKSHHTLEGTYHGPDGPMAVINGQVLRPGDVIDQFRVIRITSFSVELRRGRDRVLLELPMAPASGARRSQPGRESN